MKSCFQWRGAPSLIGMGLINQKVKKPDLEPKRLHVYAEAIVSDQTREDQIAQVNREVEHHFALAQEESLSSQERAIHRDYARQLAAKVRALVQGRSAAFVAKLEQERGLA